MNWTALGVTITILLAAIGFVVFLADLRSGVKTLTDVVREVRDDMKVSAGKVQECLSEQGERLNGHDVLFAKVNTLLDLDDSAQSLLRDRLNRRANIRRSQDQVNEDVREIMRLDRLKEG